MTHHTLTINYKGTELQILALLREEGHVIVYDCYNGDVTLGTIQPTMNNDGPIIVWVGDVMPDDLVKLIADEIERQDR